MLLTNRSLRSAGGIERSMYQIAKILAARSLDYKVTMVSLETQSAKQMDSYKEELRIIEYPEKKDGFPIGVISRKAARAKNILYGLKDQIKPDILLVRHLWLAWAALKTRICSNIIYIAPTAQTFKYRSYWKDGWKSRNDFFSIIPYCIYQAIKQPIEAFFCKKYEAEILRDNTTVIAFSNNVRLGLCESVPEAKEKIHVLTPGVDHDIFHKASEKEQAKLKLKLKLSASSKIIIYVGRINVEKNLEFLIRSFALVNCPDKKLLVVGQGSLQKYLERLANSQGIGDKVIFAGNQFENLNMYYSLARANVLPTKIEGFGFSHIEALSCGVPTIGFSTTNSGFHTATDEIIQDAANGFLVKDATIEAFAEKLTKVLTMSDPQWEKMSRVAEQSAENYRWNSFVDALLSLTPDRS